MTPTVSTNRARAHAGWRAIATLLVLCTLPACDDDPQQPQPGPGAPSALQAAVVGTNVRVAWTLPPASSGNTRVKLLRNLNAAPAGPDDPASTVVYLGAGTSTTEGVQLFLPDHGTSRKYFYAAYGCNAAGACETTGVRDTLALTLLQCLRGGGYTFYWRHANANVCADNTTLGTAANTTRPGWWRSCVADCDSATARQLAQSGYDEAMALHDDFTLHTLPFSRVLSSEYCRCLTTAQMADLGPTIEQDLELSYFVGDEPNRCAYFFGILAQIPAAGTNLAIFGHLGLMGACGETAGLAPAECAIYKPDGAVATQVARVLYNQWGTLP